MALRKCKDCGNTVSPKSDKCPFCGAPIKNRIEKIGFWGTIFIIAIVVIIISYLTTFFENRAKKKERIDQQRVTAQQRERERASFLNSIEKHYQGLLTAYKNTDLKQASNELRLFRRYNKLDYKNVAGINKEIRIVGLERKVRKIPVSEAGDNLRIYRQLLKLDPYNAKYKMKIAFYKAKVEEQKRKEEEVELARQRRIARFGDPPVNSPWDGSVRCVKEYLKEIARDPDSLKFEKWGKVAYSDEDGWLVWCQFRGKNAFGGYVRNIKWFVIRQGRVVVMKDFAAYR